MKKLNIKLLAISTVITLFSIFIIGACFTPADSIYETETPPSMPVPTTTLLWQDITLYNADSVIATFTSWGNSEASEDNTYGYNSSRGAYIELVANDYWAAMSLVLDGAGTLNLYDFDLIQLKMKGRNGGEIIRLEMITAYSFESIPITFTLTDEWKIYSWDLNSQPYFQWNDATSAMCPDPEDVGNCQFDVTSVNSLLLAGPDTEKIYDFGFYVDEIKAVKFYDY